ncbi:MAG: ornithine cyclodeaminase [Peptostreptococcaceae bacterium]
MKIITHEDIMDLKINYNELYEWIKDSFNSKDSAILPGKTSITQPNGIFFNTMPSMMDDVFGVKVVTRKSDRKPTIDSQIYLYNKDTYNVECILDGNYITAMRTAAVSVLSIDLLAKKDFKTISFMGLGLVSVATLKMICEIFKGRDFTIKLLKYKDQHTELIERFKSYDNLTFAVEENIENLVKGSDVLLSAITYTDGTVSEYEWYDEGVLVLPVHVKGFSNIDKKFDKVFMDDFNNTKVIEGVEDIRYKCEITSLLNDLSLGRQNDKEKIVSYNIGLSTHDILFANNIFKKFSNKNNDIYLNKIEDKIWL